MNNWLNIKPMTKLYTILILYNITHLHLSTTNNK